jgi:hypothetical protein
MAQLLRSVDLNRESLSVDPLTTDDGEHQHPFRQLVPAQPPGELHLVHFGFDQLLQPLLPHRAPHQRERSGITWSRNTKHHAEDALSRQSGKERVHRNQEKPEL